jgi:CO/xanthine dehydrogenase FAD-binding subunit
VDLQSVGLNSIHRSANKLEIGASTTLQAVCEASNLAEPLRRAIELEAPLNLRTAATVAGTLMVADGRSSLATVLLALDADVHLASSGWEANTMPEGTVRSGSTGRRERGIDQRVVRIGDLLPQRSRMAGVLITAVVVPLNVMAAFKYISRTPVDKPIVCAALVRWASGRCRLALGGTGASPLLAVDGAGDEGLEPAARNAFDAAADAWASAEYRAAMAAVLARRCREDLQALA